MVQFEVRVPATTANLGPGFDCLGLTLDLWNITHFSDRGPGIRVEVFGEGADHLAQDETNLIARAFKVWFKEKGQDAPENLQIDCHNSIPLGSGLGSSAAATLTGILAANAWLGEDLNCEDTLRIANQMEGHADNAAAALYGGLILVLADQNPLVVTPLAVQPLEVVVVLPEVKLSTRDARDAIPKNVLLKDAIFNLGRTPMVVEGLRSGNFGLLTAGMQDLLHQPYRLKLIPGAQKAMQAARDLGAPAALSGAGPSVIAFGINHSETVMKAMQDAFQDAGLKSRGWILKLTTQGAQVISRKNRT